MEGNSICKAWHPPSPSPTAPQNTLLNAPFGEGGEDPCREWGGGLKWEGGVAETTPCSN